MYILLNLLTELKENPVHRGPDSRYYKHQRADGNYDHDQKCQHNPAEHTRYPPAFAPFLSDFPFFHFCPSCPEILFYLYNSILSGALPDFHRDSLQFPQSGLHFCNTLSKNKNFFKLLVFTCTIG